MVVIKIDSIQQELKNLDEGWLLQQINRRRQHGDPVCVMVEIDDSPIKLILPAGECNRAAGIARQFSAEEETVIDLWRKHHLDQPEFEGGELIAFLKQLRRLVD